MKIQLSDHFTYGRLVRFTMPSILMTLFTSVYATVDGLFVSNLVGKTAFAALNLIYPYLMILGGVVPCWAWAAARWLPRLWASGMCPGPGGILP